MESKENMSSLPIPDPTTLTTEQLRRELQALRELLETRMEGADRVQALLKERIDGCRQDCKNDNTHLTALVASNLAAEVVRTNTLKQVTLEKFTRIDTQFVERDTRTDQRAVDTKLAVDAAFAAAKEATAKIEAGFTKQIDGMVETVNTKTQNLETRIVELKDRQTALESRLIGSSKAGSDIWGFAVGAVGMLLAIVSMIALIIKWAAV